MSLFEDFGPEEKKRIVEIWKAMSPQDREHFINQAAIGLSVWGSDDKGKNIITNLIRNMLEDGSKNLADFGLYLEFLDEKIISGKEERFRKAIALIDSYRFKHDLPSEPNKDFIFNDK